MLRAVDLKTEYMSNPMGIHTRQPRFFWNLTGTGKHQSAWRIQVVSGDGGKGWDSGKVQDTPGFGVRFGGKELFSRERLRWRVKLWDENDEEGPWSEEATFEMGLLKKQDWSAWWITGDFERKKGRKYPADCFAREFRIINMPQRARLYLSACGVCEVRINGRIVGSECLLPGRTDSRKRLNCMVWDVLPWLITGTNRLELVLGGGWHTACSEGTEPKILAQLEMTDELGDRIILGTDRSFRWSSDGETGRNNILLGETVHCGKVPSLTGKAKLTKWPVTPAAIQLPPIREQYRLTPTLLTTPSGASVLDFGENVSAMVAFSGMGEAGQELRLYFSEYLEDDGEFPRRQKGRKKPRLTLHLSGETDTYRQRLSYTGFRYILVENRKEIPAEAFTAVVISSDLGYTGSFVCSDARVNALVENTRRSMRSAFLDAPAHSPAGISQPDAADALAFFETSVCLGGTAPFWRKWLEDMADAQSSSGAYSAAAPAAGKASFPLIQGHPARCGAGALLTWRFWKSFGDREILISQYPSLRKYAYFLMRKAFRTPFWARFLRNPWEQYTLDTIPGRCELLEPEEENPAGLLQELFPHREESTAWFAAVMAAMADMAAELGNGPDSRLFREYADGARKAYSWIYSHRRRFRPRSPARQLLPLALGLLPRETDTAGFRRLIKELQKRSYRACTGAFTTAMLLPELTARGCTEDAYRLLLNEEEPGWLSQIENGAVSLWENWYGRDVRGQHAGSRNRYVFGSVVQWLFQDCAGIRLNGERHFVLEPHPGGGLTFAKASVKSLFGTVSLEWQALYGGWSFEVDLPLGTTAELHLPDGSVQLLDGGHHFFGV